MPLEENRVPNNRKRRPSVDREPAVLPSPLPPAKRRKQDNQQRHRTPRSFWDNLSRQWLTRRALRELDQRTVWPVAPLPPHWSGKEKIARAQLKRFARHGGPDLGDLRGVSDTQSFEWNHTDWMLY